MDEHGRTRTIMDEHGHYHSGGRGWKFARLDWDGQYFGCVPDSNSIKGEMYWDLGFDGRFDVKAIYNGNKAGESKEHLVYVGNEWLPAKSLNIAEGWAIIRRGGKDVRLRFVPNKGWVAAGHWGLR